MDPDVKDPIGSGVRPDLKCALASQGWSAQADYACVPNAAAGAIPAVVPKVGFASRTGVGIDDDTAVLLGNLLPQNVIGELAQNIAK